MARQVTSQATLYLTQDKSAVVVGDGNPAAAFLLVRAGMNVDVDDLKKHGLPLDGTIPEFDKETGIAKPIADEAKAKGDEDGGKTGDDGKTDGAGKSKTANKAADTNKPA